MSGNPFRRKAPPEAIDAWYSGDSTSINRLSPPPETERRRSSVKRVRIQTPPPLSPDSVYEDEDPDTMLVGNETHEGSPPPDPNRMDITAIGPAATLHDDPLGRTENEEEISANEELLNNTRQNSATGSASIVEVPIIKNPFQRTLATMGPKAANEAAAIPQDEPTEGRYERSALDVDSFKRLLMTGTKDNATEEPSPAPSSATTSSYFDSSGTDASSVSRHSMYDETSTTSLSGEPANDKAFEDDGFARPILSRGLSHSRQPPPPPRHRHGKSIGQPSPSADIPPKVEHLSTSISTAVPNTSNAPPPPPPRKTGVTDSRAQPSTSSRNSLDSSEPTQSAQSFVREARNQAASHSVPPQPPLPRRTSNKIGVQDPTEARHAHTASPWSFSATTSTRALQDMRNAAKPPPPPPSRRAGANRNSALGLGSPQSPPSPSSDSTPASDIPSRSSSISSQNRPMPPPPPPRRRGSSRSSLDQVSTAGPSNTSARPSLEGRRSSVTSLNSVTEGVESQTSRGKETVLADMEALQAEIDALRSQYGRRI